MKKIRDFIIIISETLKILFMIFLFYVILTFSYSIHVSKTQNTSNVDLKESIYSIYNIKKVAQFNIRQIKEKPKE